jgi:hypothetical protein
MGARRRPAPRQATDLAGETGRGSIIARNALVPVFVHEIAGEQVQAVNLRELHENLEAGGIIRIGRKTVTRNTVSSRAETT